MRLLVVEDYEPLRRSLVAGLTEAGFAVDATGDGKEGLWYAGDEVYDAVVLDLMLPGMDGLSLLKKIRRDGKKCPVLILTAKDKVADRIAGLNQGADDYLVKPFAFEELLARIHALVRRKYDVRTTEISVGELHIDLKGKSVRWGDEAIELTAREFGVMEVLALNKGEVVTRTEISQHIYGFDGEPDSNAIDVHIAQLRKKIESEGRPKLIQTRRGMGYVLDEAGKCVR